MYLQMRGHEVTTVYSGNEAILAFEAASFDWIVMDIGMPKLNGYETARKIRCYPSGRTVKLVALTGWGQESDKQLAAEAGFNHHFTKPINPTDLAEIIEARRL
jgi:CheY-like chemotaxis protein